MRRILSGILICAILTACSFHRRTDFTYNDSLFSVYIQDLDMYKHNTPNIIKSDANFIVSKMDGKILIKQQVLEASTCPLWYASMEIENKVITIFISDKGNPSRKTISGTCNGLQYYQVNYTLNISEKGIYTIMIPIRTSPNEYHNIIVSVP